MFYIAYDGNCTPCSNIADSIRVESSGKLKAQTIDSFINEHGIKISTQKPSLIEINSGLVKNIYTGPSMSIKVLKLVGPQKAAKIFSILAAETRSKNINRRLTLTGIAATFGIALTGAS